MEYLIALLASLTVLSLVIYFLRSQALSPADARLNLLSPSRTVEVDSADGSILRRAPSAIPAVGRLLDGRGPSERWSVDLERANLTLRPIEYLLMRTLFGRIRLPYRDAYLPQPPRVDLWPWPRGCSRS